jgi:hypothetical protein
VARRHKPAIWLVTALLLTAAFPARAQPAQVNSVNTIADAFARLRTCWRPPSDANPGIDITVIVSFNRDGNIIGHPRITYESEHATDNDRLKYRFAVMEALQRCTPMPFTGGMAGAIAGRPFAVQFHNRKSPPQPTEKRAWLTPKIL